jgi:hypothetical protein
MRFTLGITTKYIDRHPTPSMTNNTIVGCCSLCVVNDQPVGKPQEEGVMSIAASFPSVKKPRLSILERRDKRLKVMQTGLIALQQGRRLMILVDSSSASSNAEPAHNTTKYFAPNLR